MNNTLNVQEDSLTNTPSTIINKINTAPPHCSSNTGLKTIIPNKIATKMTNELNIITLSTEVDKCETRLTRRRKHTENEKRKR